MVTDAGAVRCRCLGSYRAGRQDGYDQGRYQQAGGAFIGQKPVARSDNPNDKRAHTLSLTASGRAKTPVLAAIADSNDANFFGVLQADERARLRSLLRMFIERSQLNVTPSY